MYGSKYAEWILVIRLKLSVIVLSWSLEILKVDINIVSDWNIMWTKNNILKLSCELLLLFFMNF